MTGISIIPAPGASVVAHAAADTSVVNSTAETALCTLTIPSDVKAGDVLEFVAGGDLLNNSGSSVNYTWKVKVGATAALASAATGIGSSSNRRMWNLRVSIVVESATAQRVFGRIHVTASSSSSWQAASFGAEGYGTVAENLAAGKTVSLTATLGTAVSTADMVLHAAALTLVRRSATP